MKAPVSWQGRLPQTYLGKCVEGDSVHMLGGEEPVQHVDEEDMVALAELEAVQDHVLVQVHHPLTRSWPSQKYQIVAAYIIIVLYV